MLASGASRTTSTTIATIGARPFVEMSSPKPLSPIPWFLSSFTMSWTGWGRGLTVEQVGGTGADALANHIDESLESRGQRTVHGASALAGERLWERPDVLGTNVRAKGLDRTLGDARRSAVPSAQPLHKGVG